MYKFEPLKIRAYLQTPVVSDQYLPLDGILFNHFVRDNFGVQIATKSRQGDAAIWTDKLLPFAKRNGISKNDWYYACSFAIWSACVLRGTMEYAKRFDTHLAVDYADFGKKKAKVDTSRGEQKNYFIKEYTFNAEYVEWYCVGDKKEIELLLPFCTHVGKKSAQGAGAVFKWEVESTQFDWSVNDADGKLMRAIPSPESNFVYGIRPSYWHPQNQTRVLMPN